MDIVVLEISEPGREARRIVVSGPADVGRECSGFLVDDRSVSRRHVAVAPHPEGLSLTDLRSRNGTLLNGAPLSGTAVARPGDVVVIGSTRIEVVGDLDPASPERTMLPSPPMRTVALQVPAHPPGAPPAPPGGATSPPPAPAAKRGGWTPATPGSASWTAPAGPLLTRRGPVPPRPDEGSRRTGRR